MIVKGLIVMRWPRLELGMFGYWDLDRLYDIQVESVLVYWIMVMRKRSRQCYAIVFQELQFILYCGIIITVVSYFYVQLVFLLVYTFPFAVS